MSLPRYAEFMDSGVPWLGQVPSHWSLPKIKHVAAFTGGGTPSRDNLEFWGGSIPWVSPKDMKVEEIREAEESITGLGLSNSSSSLVARGQVLLVVRSGILKHTIPVAVNAVEVALNQDMKALRLDPKRCTSSFFLRWVQGLNDQLLLAWAKQGATVESIEHGYMAESIIPLPALGEQVAIDRFLDYETAKIDALVEEQRRLIELLKEKRHAVISQVVTKGLNPNVPMKDCGVTWLGKVPAHWDVSRLRYVARPGTSITYGIVQAGPHVEDGIPYIKTSDMSGPTLPLDGYSKTTAEIDASYARSKVAAGDLVIAIRASVGKCLPVPAQLDGANLTQGTAKIAPGDLVDARFLLAYINALPVQTYLNSVSKGATFKEITLDTLRKTPVPLPPLTEQRLIASHVHALNEQFQELIDGAEAAEALLLERRVALISAAVTGKIDVRGLAPQPEAVAA